MDKNEESRILALDGFMKQGAGYVIANAGKIIAAITLAIAFLTIFANITFTSLNGAAFTITLIVMLFSSYVMYFSLEDAGEKEGEGCKEHIEARERFIEARKKINPDDIEALREFCLKYSEDELFYRKRNYLCENGLTSLDLERYGKGEKFPRRAQRVLKRAGLMKAVKLSVSRLLSLYHGTPESELSPPEKSKLVRTLTSLIPSTLCTLFTVSIILTAKGELSLSTVIDGLIKLSALPMIGFKGFLDGYRYVKDAKTAWFETKTRILEAFLIEHKR